MVRTVNEELCTDCHSITNYYDPNMGRLCPKCTASRCASFGKGLALQGKTGRISSMEPVNPDEDMKYLADSNKHLLTDPLIDHSEDLEISASAYHISNAIWEQWLEDARLAFAKPYMSKASRQQFLLDVRELLYKVALASAKVFALKNHQPTFTLPNQGARKKCSRYATCLSQLDWNSNYHKTGFSMNSCPNKCEFYVESYTIWAF